MAGVAAVVVPYELGRLRDGVGCGPERLVERGALDALGASGAEVTLHVVELDPRFSATGLGEGDAGFELIGLVAEEVRRARQREAFPVILSGSCYAAAVGAVVGIEEERPGVVYLDAHPDASEPVTSISGYLDSMGLAILTGHAWQGMLATVPGARPVASSSVVLAGVRSSEPPETASLEAWDIAQVEPDRLATPDALVNAVARITPEITGLYLHVDLDVLDSSVATANIYSEPGGPDGDQLVAVVTALLHRFPVRALSLTCYDPACDEGERLPPIALRILEAVAERVAAES